MSEPTSRELLRQYVDGDDEAATAIFDRYVRRLLALAEARIAPKLRPRLDADDVVQSAYRSFFVGAREREYQLTRAGDLWRLLAATTLNKLRSQVEKQTAAKRSIRREHGGGRDDVVGQAASPEPNVVEVIAAGEQLHLVLQTLTTDEQSVLLRTLQGASVDEIAEALERSPRTIRRILKAARERFEASLLSVEEPERTLMRPPPLNAPRKYSDYVFEQLLGAGGMGKVYRARQRSTGELVAVKTLHKSRQSDPRAVARFVQEAEILAELRHSNIIGVRGLGRFPAGGLFLVMDFVDGGDLQARIAVRPLDVKTAARVAKPIALALEHAHSAGVVHCDLKPGNVLIDRSDRVVVTDFGFAQIVSAVSIAGIGGTAGYIAPEILAGGTPSAAADIYGLGALLWAMVRGQPPTAGETSAPAEFGALAAICQRCLATHPADRYADARQVHDALRQLDASPDA